MDKNNQKTSSRKGKLYTFSLLLAGLLATGGAHYTINKTETNFSIQRFEENWLKKQNDQADKFKEAFQTIYHSLRTIALLPGVEKIDRYGLNFAGDSEVTVQQIYNNLASQINVSELYIVPNDFNPEQIDPNTGKPEAPITTFDEIIIGKSANQSSVEYQDIELEEVEIFEYRQMKKQIDYFKEKMPNRSDIDGMAFPFLVSSEVITCDNRNFSSTDLAKKNDAPRMGIVLSVPFYDSEDNLKGIVSAVVRTIVLSKMIDEPYFALSNPSQAYIVTPINYSDELKPYNESIKKGEVPETMGDIFFSSKEEITITPESSLFIFTSIPKSLWEQSPYFESVQQHSLMIWIIGLSLSLILSSLLGGLFYTRSKAVELAKKMTQAFEDKQKELLQSQKMDAIGQLAGGIAHDFNNILGVIMGYASLLEKKLKDHPDELKKIQNILLATEKAKELTTQILGFARKGQYEKKAIDLNQIITEASRLLALGLNKKIQLVSNLASDLWSFEGDSSQTLQAILNLGVNACDAMPDGGTLTFETKNLLVDEAYSSIHKQLKPGRYVYLSVADTGLGIPKDIQSKIFEPFFTTKEIGTGSGLGLSMIYGIVQNHGGDISVYSEPGKGSIFHIYFPAEENIIQETSIKLKADNKSINLAGQNILIVDDEEQIRHLSQMIVEAAGATTLFATNGKEAVEIFNAQPDKISLILMDVIMPELSGIEAYKKIVEKHPSIVTLFCSGYSQDDEVASIRNNARVDFIQKPFTAENLLEKIASLPLEKANES